MDSLEQVNYKVFVATRRNFMIGLVVAFVSVSLILMAVIPQFREILSLRQDLEIEKPKLAKLEQKLIDLDRVVYTPEFAQIDLVNSALPSKKPLLELLASLNQAAQSSEVIIQNFEVSPGLVASDSTAIAEELASRSKTQSEGYDRLDLKLDIKGEFSQVQEFMRLAERFAPFTSVTEFQLSERGSTGNEQQFQPQSLVSISLVTDTYFFTQSIQVTVDSKLPEIGNQERFVLQQLESLQPADLPEQLEIQGGGLEDLFGIEGFDFSQIN